MGGFEIRKAERKRLKARIGISGASGSGKTYSSLLIMRGLVGPSGRICVLDTEQSSSEMYSGLGGDFDVLPLDAPYTPARYMAALDAIEAAGYDGIITDQITNEWNGPGGILEMVDKAKSANRGSDFSAWNGPSQLHRAFVDRLLRVNAHLIVTLRSKTAYVLELNARGKQAPRKIGMAPEQRDGIEYEFQIMLDLSTDGHMASVSKDRTGLLRDESIFHSENFVPSIEVGKRIADFLSSGAPLAQQPKAPELPAQSVACVSTSQQKAIVSVARDRGLGRDAFLAIVQQFAPGVTESAKVPASAFDAVLAVLQALPELVSSAEANEIMDLASSRDLEGDRYRAFLAQVVPGVTEAMRVPKDSFGAIMAAIRALPEVKTAAEQSLLDLRNPEAAA